MLARGRSARAERAGGARGRASAPCAVLRGEGLEDGREKASRTAASATMRLNRPSGAAKMLLVANIASHIMVRRARQALTRGATRHGGGASRWRAHARTNILARGARAASRRRIRERVPVIGTTGAGCRCAQEVRARAHLHRQRVIETKWHSAHRDKATKFDPPLHIPKSRRTSKPKSHHNLQVPDAGEKYGCEASGAWIDGDVEPSAPLRCSCPLCCSMMCLACGAQREEGTRARARVRMASAESHARV